MSTRPKMPPNGGKAPSKKLSPVGRVKNHSKAGAFLPKKPIKDGMATQATDKRMSKIAPGDAKPSYKGTKDTPGSATAGVMKATGKTAKFRKKANKR